HVTSLRFTPAPVGVNLSDVTWNATPIFSQRLIIGAQKIKQSCGVAVRRTIANEFATDAMIDGTWEAGAAAPTSANFVLRARLHLFDTENSVTNARGTINAQPANGETFLSFGNSEVSARSFDANSISATLGGFLQGGTLTSSGQYSVNLTPTWNAGSNTMTGIRMRVGFFQLWHATCLKAYPWSLGTAAHDDVMFAAEWPCSHRRHLPTVLCYHLCARSPRLGENWDGNRRQPRF
ncbi:MAG TPA: hypothetical protein VFD27_04765, partial [Chthoniobacteraceae bacterium]|nr:hypothetical protein [Chthoniobacteraceae bacterium]